MNWLERQVHSQPDAVALHFEESSWTWSQLEIRVRRMAAALTHSVQVAGGIRGARIATLMHSSPDYIVTILAVQWAGATLVPINTRLTAREISWMLNNIEADLLVLDHQTAERFYDSADATLDLQTTRFVQVEELTFSLDVEPADFRAREAALIMYTSGTTGLPKPVELSWENVASSAFASAVVLGLEARDNWLCALPLFHIGGLSIVFRCLIYGIPLTLLEKFDEQRVAEAIIKHNITLASFVPTMLHRLRGILPEVNHLRAVLLGGGPAPKELVEWAWESGIPVFQTYGLTEAGSQVTTMPPKRALEKIGSAGIAVFGADVQVRRLNMSLAAPNEPGHIWIRGSMVMRGYLGRATENERRFDGAWFDTGDFGYLDDDQFLWVLSRRDDLIITGGENVYPAEVENVILGFEGVDQAAVFGQEDGTWGELVCVALVAQEGAEIDLEALEAHCRRNLAGFKVPRRWLLLEELPQTSSGKVRRHELKKL